MKAEVLLHRRGETKIEDGSMELNVTMETEQYSPSDFINHLVTDERQAHSSSPDDRCLFTRQQGTKLSPQTVIRPIPILPIDSSVYTSPPTYIDNIQAAITVPVMQHAPLIASHFGKSSSLSLPANQESEVCSKSDSVVKSQVSPESMLHSTNDMLDCKWMNCEQQFSCMDDLVMHVNDHHVRVERPDVEYQCKWGGCPRKGKGFNARYKMLIHIRTHTNEKPHKCSRCGKSFSRLENLKIHMRSHTGEKPYTCPFEGCNKAYSNSSDRFKHVRTHQEDKPYICKMPGCNKRYTDPSSLRKHVRTHGHNYKEAIRENGNFTISESNVAQESNIETIRTSNVHSCVDMSGNIAVPHTKMRNKPSGKVSRQHEGSGIRLINISSLISNPLLSSTIVPVTSHEIISQTEVPLMCSVRTHSVNTSSNVRHIENVKMILPKSQEIPLDLSTCSSSSESCATEAEISASMQSPKIESGSPEIGRWEIIHMSS